MFGTTDFDHTGVETYADALAYFERATPWRGETAITDERPMEHRRHRNYGVRNDGGVIRFRMHQTDVVSYHPDGTIEFDVYNSVTTDSFVNSLVGWSISSHFTGEYMVIDELAYRAVSYVTVRPTRNGQRRVVTTKMWSKYVVDRKKTNAAIRKHAPHLPEAAAWYKAAEALGALSQDPGNWDWFAPRLPLETLIENLKDQSNWKCLRHDTIDLIRNRLTERYALKATKPVNGIPVSEINAYRAAWRKWGQP
jgi:hypothetical protein